MIYTPIKIIHIRLQIKIKNIEFLKDFNKFLFLKNN